MCKLTGSFLLVNSKEIARICNNSEDLDTVEDYTNDFAMLDEDSTENEIIENLDKYRYVVDMDNGGMISRKRFLNRAI